MKPENMRQPRDRGHLLRGHPVAPWLQVRVYANRWVVVNDTPATATKEGLDVFGTAWHRRD